MSKAYEVMTQKVATCSPDTNIAQVAAIMKDRDIGNVLIVEDGKLRGIVTDRDLALRGLIGEDDPLQTPIKKLMSTKVVTGDAGWSLERVAEVMAKHQVRRLPIVENGQVVGIISLGDVALHEDRKEIVTKSLQAISKQRGISAGHSGGAALFGITMAALATSMLAWFTFTESGHTFRKQLTKSEAFHTARQAISAAGSKVGEAATSKPVRELGQRVRSNPLILAALIPLVSSAKRGSSSGIRSTLNTLAAQLPVLAYKQPRRKLFRFG